MKPAAAGTDASTISIPDVLQLLDTDFNELAEGIADGRYALWIGSGISLERVDGVKKLVSRILKYLWQGAAVEGGAGPFTDAFRNALSEGMPAAKAATIDPTADMAALPNLDDVLDRLVSNYSKLLDVVVKGKDADHLLWDVVGVVKTYADPATLPDCEHLCIAILALEGLVPRIASANWDDLIEKAAEQISPTNDNPIAVHVRKEDFRAGAGLRTELYKFHGCARRAGQDEATYRPLLVGRASQIAKWGTNKDFAVARQRLVDTATVSPTFVVGLSIQDPNLQVVFTEGQDKMGWNYPAHPPAFVFASQNLGGGQGTLLRCVYGDEAYAQQTDAIEAGAKLPAYGKSALLGLVIHMVGSRQMHALLTATHDAGAKLVLVGDPEQLRAIDAGAAFRAVVERTGAATMSEVRRQRVGWQQEATVDLAQGRTMRAVRAYEEAGGLKRFDDTDGAMHAIFAAWTADQRELPAGKNSVMLASTNVAVDALNARVRDMLKASGRLGAEMTIRAVDEAIDRPRTEFDLSVAVGERLMFKRNDYQLDVRNGTVGTVTGMKANRLQVHVDGTTARLIDIDLSKFRNFDYAYAMTIHKAQGITTERTHVLAERNMDKNLTYVALSRHRERASLYWSGATFSSRWKLEAALSRDRVKDTTLDYTSPQPRLRIGPQKEPGSLGKSVSREFSRSATSTTDSRSAKLREDMSKYNSKRGSPDFGREL